MDMVNEHYVPRSYLSHFAPEDENVISRYSLVEKHGGGDYYPPRDRYPVSKAAAIEGFADGWFENDETVSVEREMIESLRNIIAGEDLVEDEIGRTSQFLAFQHSRTPRSILYYKARQRLPPVTGDNYEELPNHFAEDWKNALYHNANHGHETLQHMGWIVLENQTEVPFITSDKPVTHYFSQDFEEISKRDMEMHGREIYCSLDPENLLVLLDPEMFDVVGQWPETQIQREAITESSEVHKFNLVQVVTAFQEVFGPIGKGGYLEELVDVLCDSFPHEDFVRGNRGDWDTLRKSHRLATGMSNDDEVAQYKEKYRDIILSRRMKSQSIWSFDHSLDVIESLRRDNPWQNYWDNLFAGESHEPF